MKNNFIKWYRMACLIWCAYLCTLSIQANPIDKVTARQIALSEVSKVHANQTKKSQGKSKIEVSFVMEGEEQSFYIFNIGENEGFVVVSGDDATEEILMSCDIGHFTEGQMPENMMEWLKGYTKQIKWLREKGVTKEQNRRKAGSFNKRYILEEDPEKAQRLARWAQSGYFGDNNFLMYNYGLPIVNDNGMSKTASTGCLPTAIAQLMYYHKWPNKIGPKNIPAYKTKTENFEMEGYDAGSKIDWDNIRQTYLQTETYSKEERKAISDLMKYVGTAIKTDYKYNGGSSTLNRAPDALTKYFGYKEMSYSDKINNEDEWLQMIYDELTTNGPVLYRGTSRYNIWDQEEQKYVIKEEGHAFLIEGIDGESLRVNWGWANSLPTSTWTMMNLCNVGDYQFEHYQAAVFGVKPNRSGELIETGLKVLTNALISKAGDLFTRNSVNEDFIDIPLLYSYTNPLDDATFDIGFLIENIETGEQTYYSLFARTLKGLKTTTTNLKFSFGNGLGDGVYRIYGASREHGANEFQANYNKTSQYLEVTIYDNKLYIGKIDDQKSKSLLDYTYANGCEYKLYGQVNYSDYRTNPDGVVFYKTNLLLDIKKNGKITTYMVDNDNIYNSSTYENMMFPCMMLDIDNDRMYVFQNSKDDDEYYGMKGYVYMSKISSINFTRKTAYEHFNCGWFPYFIGPLQNGYPGLHHFSYAGYYEMISIYEDGEWETYYISRMDPSDAEKDGKSHSPFLVVGDNRVSDDMAEYCPSNEEDGLKMLSVDSSVSGDFTIPEMVNGSIVNSIASYAFSACDNITSVTIPETITSIEEYAFGTSKNLSSIKVMSPVPVDLSYSYEHMVTGGGDSYSDNHFVMTPFELVDKSRCVLYVPRGSRDAYSLAVGWGDFQNIEEHDDISSIGYVQARKNTKNVSWYNITGSVLGGRPSTKGVYIHNGNKYVVK